MINHHDSWTHRLPPEMLVTVASHLKGDTSLIAATHVCHLWRVTLLSSSRLWSHLDFANEERALAFLERSKSSPLSVDITDLEEPTEIVRESLKKATTRVTTLWAAHDSFLDELLAQSMPELETLDIIDVFELPPKKPIHLPSLTSLVVSGFDPLQFHVPLLTSFHLTHDPTSNSRREWTANIFLDFFRNCPLLEDVILSCDVLPDSSDGIISLPLLRTFTHESPCDESRLRVFDRLSLPPTCRVVLVVNGAKHHSGPRIPGLPTPRDSSYLSDIRTLKIATKSGDPGADEHRITFKIELANSAHRAISFDRISWYHEYPSALSHRGFLDIFENIETGSVETLCFDHYPTITPYEALQVTPEYVAQGLRRFRNLKTLILVGCDIIPCLNGLSSCPTVDTLVVHFTYFAGPSASGVVSKVEELAVSRKGVGTPLRALTLVFPSTEPRSVELERLTSYVGRVEVVSGDDALSWNVDRYLGCSHQ